MALTMRTIYSYQGSRIVNGEKVKIHYRSCDRIRCSKRIEIVPTDEEGVYTLPEDALILSYGRIQRMFCGFHCASLWASKEARAER